jgi:hypothetical protein
MKRWPLFVVSHAVVAAAGFAAGIYALPLLIAPPAPPAAELAALADQALFKGRFTRDLPGSDRLHWGEGEVAVGRNAVSLQGSVSPGPDYKLYLSPEFVDDEASFLRVKGRMLRVGDVKTFSNFVVPLPQNVDPAAYNTVVVWCEAFGEFISAAKYRE